MRKTTGLFWGIVLILLGMGIILRITFNIDIPVFKILVALFLIYLGLRIIRGGGGMSHSRQRKEDVVFTENIYKDAGDEDKEYNVIFGKGVYDLRNVNLNRKVNVEINALFGGAEIRLRKDMPYRIKVDSVFGGANLPDGNTTVLGTSRFQSENYHPDHPFINIKVSVVFGGLEVFTY